MPQYVKKGDKVLEIPREIRAKGPKAVEAFMKEKGMTKAAPAKKKEGAES